MTNSIVGAVATINDGGDLVTDIIKEQLAEVPRDESVSISFGGHETVGIFPPNHEQPESTLVAVLGQSGYLEIGIVGMSLSSLLGIGVGETVQVCW